MKKIFCTVLLLFFAIGFVDINKSFASGFSFYDWSARGSAMGGAVVANARDASAVVYNPALITQLERNSLQVGLSYVKGSEDINFKDTTNATGSWTTNSSSFVPHAYSSIKISEKVWFGIGEFTRFHTDTKYPIDFAGNSYVENFSLSTYSIMPVFAVKVFDSFSVSFGPEFMYASMDWQSRGNTSVGARNYEVSDLMSISNVFAGHYKLSNIFSFGIVHRTQVSFEGTGEGTEIKTTLPSSTAFGLALQLFPPLLIEADLVYTGWDVYDSLRITQENGSEEYMSKNWENTWRVQVGLELTLMRIIALRGGFAAESSPVNVQNLDFFVSPGASQSYSFGVGLHFSNLYIDASYVFKNVNEVKSVSVHSFNNVDFLGKTSHTVTASLSFIF